jgi:hypothetical protein
MFINTTNLENNLATSNKLTQLQIYYHFAIQYKYFREILTHIYKDIRCSMFEIGKKESQ